MLPIGNSEVCIGLDLGPAPGMEWEQCSPPTRSHQQLCPCRIIATPGRLVHVAVEMKLKLHTVEYVVFDEADRSAGGSPGPGGSPHWAQRDRTGTAMSRVPSLQAL